MKFLITAIAVVLLIIPVESRSEGGNFDLEKIQTRSGRTYHDILILGSDSHGLTFRHRVGIAKIDFASLSENIRMLYEVADAIPEAGANRSESAVPAVDRGDSSAPVLTVYHRLTLYAPRYQHSTCHPCERTIYWPAWWPRYHPAHQLTIPCYRERTVRDFLFLSGLSRGDCQGLYQTGFAEGGLLPSHRGF